MYYGFWAWRAFCHAVKQVGPKSFAIMFHISVKMLHIGVKLLRINIIPRNKQVMTFSRIKDIPRNKQVMTFSRIKDIPRNKQVMTFSSDIPNFLSISALGLCPRIHIIYTNVMSGKPIHSAKRWSLVCHDSLRNNKDTALFLRWVIKRWSRDHQFPI